MAEIYDPSDLKMAVVALGEEAEGASWYDRHMMLCDDEALRAIFKEACDQEKQHLAKINSWIVSHIGKVK